MASVQNSKGIAAPLGISKPLLRWYDRHARELPWRISPADRKKGMQPDPYRVWLSEIMLQQTTVATVTPRYQRFLDLWPTLSDLASARQEEVLAEWAGLGYYARAHNLHKCAQVLQQDHDGLFPETAQGLLALPGIGPYTAAAIAAISFDEPAPVMDGNIERVMARLYAVETPLPDAKPVLRAYAAQETPVKRPGDHAQALMDVGATICTPRKPVCSLCPLSQFCGAQSRGIAADLPRKKKKADKPTRHGTAFVIRRKSDNHVLLVRRAPKGLLGGMLAPPTTDWRTEKSIDPSPPFRANWQSQNKVVRHTFTHFHLVLEVQETIVATHAKLDLEGEWVADPLTAGLPTVFRKIFLPSGG
ncbi:A/G-specific adenine glycosylase [Parvularcula sp. IMCC14364]|uniref:A/G-specific adenine glycosylase n=1 Tax=Parvularcula sp. IMCC14364 TaxID=3067902 RepID=UPI0027403F4A|nr:A/G-specific adenine glycosylase [Parvularcula sp. IMCC14364]